MVINTADISLLFAISIHEPEKKVASHSSSNYHMIYRKQGLLGNEGFDNTVSLNKTSSNSQLKPEINKSICFSYTFHDVSQFIGNNSKFQIIQNVLNT
jgi:hypothetical protein